MLRTIVVVLCTSVALLTACSAEPCEDSARPLPTSWSAHPDLVAPGGTMCRADDGSAAVDYETDTNPFVLVVDHLEAQGWERTTQNIENSESMLVAFRKEGEQLTVTVDSFGEYSRVLYRAR